MLLQGKKTAFGNYGRYSLLRKELSREEVSALDRFLLMQNLWGESYKIDWKIFFLSGSIYRKINYFCAPIKRHTSIFVYKKGRLNIMKAQSLECWSTDHTSTLYLKNALLLLLTTYKQNIKSNEKISIGAIVGIYLCRIL